MLVELKVANFAIIRQVTIEFRPGLNIMSGETGAGKSVLLKSLALLMGEKADSEDVRTGCESATIEGYFDLSSRADLLARLQSMELPTEDDAMIVRRIIARNGKGRVYINGVLSPVSALRDLVTPLVALTGHSEPLIEMTGQHDNRHLLSRSYHLELLDQYAGTIAQRQNLSEKFRKLSELKNRIEETVRSSQWRAQQIDFLAYQRDEIRALDLKPNEEVDLEAEVKRMKNSARLTGFVEQAEAALYGDDDSALARLQTVVAKAHELSKYDAALGPLAEPLTQAKTLIEDTVFELRSHVSRLDNDPQSLENLEKRLSDLRHLQKKYGSTATEILEALEKIERDLGELSHCDSNLKEQSLEMERLQAELRREAMKLSERRRHSSVRLQKAVNEELRDLNMKGLAFLVVVSPLAELSSAGLDEIEFQTQTSSSDPPRPLAKFASGGELSRILLSIKQVVGHSKFPRTYLFDEVDTGVSGTTAEKVGLKLRAIARNQQVICVTHLPQVACCGNAHFFIQKSLKGHSVEMQVVELKQKHRIDEIARLISGETITKTSLAHAEQLLRHSLDSSPA